MSVHWESGAFVRLTRGCSVVYRVRDALLRDIARDSRGSGNPISETFRGQLKMITSFLMSNRLIVIMQKV